MKLNREFAALSIAVLLFSGCGDEKEDRDVDIIPAEEKTADEAREDPLAGANTVYAHIGEDENLSMFSERIEAAGLGEEISGEEGPVTIFAPSNDAYEKNSTETGSSESAPAPENADLIEYYMVDGELTVDFLRKEVEEAGGEYALQTRQGENLMVILENDEIVLLDGSGNRARIQDESIVTDNGVVHSVDEVLMPRNQAVVEENEIEVNID